MSHTLPINSLCSLETTKQRREPFSWGMDCDIGWCRRSWGSETHTQSPLGGHRLEHFVLNKQHLSLAFFIRLQINHFTSSMFLIWWKKMKIKPCFHRGLAGRIGPGVPSGPSCWFFVFLLPLENTTFGVIKRDFHHYMSTLIDVRMAWPGISRNLYLSIFMPLKSSSSNNVT